MTKEDPEQADCGVGSLPGLHPVLQGAQASELQLRINNSICKSVQSKVESILQDIEKFSDIEKLYLYLKLPSSPTSSSSDKSDQSSSSSRTQQMHAYNWICDHLEEYPETSLPKQEVHDEYKSYCDNLNYHPLSAADFGKMMKNVFPNMKARRLGMRGKSKYCYSGLRKRPHVQMPSLPNLDLKTPDGHHSDILESPAQINNIKEEVRFAACDLVCEWAQRVLKRSFDTVEDLARFLIDSHNIGNKSLAALTILTGTATELKPSQTISAFASSAETHPFQSQVSTLSSPSVDAKQQLQRKIQRKQQEQKLHSSSPVDGQSKRPDENIATVRPISASPQPTIGIMVTAVPSPITVHRSIQPMCPSPVGMIESKVLPINFQMVTQPIQTVKQSPRPAQNLLPSPAGERTVRQRYAQILPKPSATSAMTVRSPSTMIIANSPMKAVMSTCHVSPVSLVKMTTLSLAPHSIETNSSFTNTLRPSSAGLDSPTVTGIGSNQNMRSASAAPILPLTGGPGHTTPTQSTDNKMEIEAKHNSQMQNHTHQILTPPAMLNGTGSAVERAASVPIPQMQSFIHLEDISNVKSSATATRTQNSNNSSNIANPVPLNASAPNNSDVSFLNTSKLSLFGGSTQGKEGFLSMKSLRKRSGFSPDLSPIKRAFAPQQPADGAVGLQHDVKNTGNNFTRLRSESAPATREVEMKLSSISSNPVHTQSTSSPRTIGFNSVAKIHNSMQRKTTSNVMETGTSISQAQHVGDVNTVFTSPGFQKQAGGNTNPTSKCLEGTPQQMYPQSNPSTDTLRFFNGLPSSELPTQEHVNYFSFDDDVTQDSIVEELVQMEEQMKMKQLQQLGKCSTLQNSALPGNMSSTNQAMTAFYHTTSNSTNSIQTPTPTSEMMGGVQNLTGESPCSHIASTTPVDSALGSSRYTPVGTPHSNCSSTVPPSPVECRNPFAFTPINSSIPGFHESSPISSSPVKPMQRPMATHPDKARLEWMNNSYNNSGGSANKTNNGMGILPGYQGLIDNHFQKPHAFAVPHARHPDAHFGRLTPISPVQQQVASMTKQEGFAVPAPLDNKSTNSCNAAFRCRSVSPAVHQRNVSGNMGNTAPLNIPRSVVSPFNSSLTPEMLNIFANSNSNVGVSSMAQRSRSVPLNIMMQTEVLPNTGQLCTSKNLSNIVLSKLEGDRKDTMRGIGINNLSSSYTARMNLTQILESNPNLSCTNNHLSLMSSDSTSTCNSERANYLINDAVNEEMILSMGNIQPHSVFGEQQQAQSTMLPSNLQQQHELEEQQLDFGTQPLLSDAGLSASNQLMEQMSEITPQGAHFPCEFRMPTELSSSMNELNGLDTNMLFNPNQQQCQYQNAAPEELMNDPMFHQITSETSHSGGLDWLESKDHPTVGLMG